MGSPGKAVVHFLVVKIIHHCCKKFVSLRYPNKHSMMPNCYSGIPAPPDLLVRFLFSIHPIGNFIDTLIYQV